MEVKVFFAHKNKYNFYFSSFVTLVLKYLDFRICQESWENNSADKYQKVGEGKLFFKKIMTVK